MALTKQVPAKARPNGTPEYRKEQQKLLDAIKELQTAVTDLQARVVVLEAA